MWLVDLNYNFECDWLIELSDNKLSDNNLVSELGENRSFLLFIIFIIIRVSLLHRTTAVVILVVKRPLVDLFR